jgi:hypothetical protein
MLQNPCVAVGEDCHTFNVQAEQALAAKNYHEAANYLKRALQVEKAKDKGSIASARSMERLAAVLIKLGHVDQARDLLKSALSIRSRLTWPEHPDVIEDMENLAHIAQIQGRTAQAAVYLERSLQAKEAVYGRDSKHLLLDLLLIGQLQYQLRQWEKAETSFRRYIAITQNQRRADEFQLGTVLTQLAFVLGAKPHPHWLEAKQLINRAITIQEKTSAGTACKETVNLRRYRAVVLSNLNDPKSELEWRWLCMQWNAHPDWRQPADCQLAAVAPLISAARQRIARQQDTKAAEADLRAAIDVLQQHYANDVQLAKDLVTEYIELADLLCTQRNFAEAERLYERAQKIILTREPGNKKTLAVIADRKLSIKRFQRR